MIIKNKWFLIILPLFLLSGLVALGACGQEEQDEISEASPDCSVIEYSVDYISEETLGEHTKVRITARVQNIGDDGVIAVKAIINEGCGQEPCSRTTKLYLKRGEEKTIHFDFWCADEIKYTVRCLRPWEF